ncbi:3-oxoacyl-ACP reductase FabG [Stenoxybacter acetivorans]|uniref:3-oxoacyl-ACP reductase FabG n=1 Tax=Stenoxybacter acetivorans TaxID=422441 RepID=UPI0005670EA7|nr:3-oxoacyl-ACP reductase FabG [Stenoxybacter acetivorans]
MQTTHSNSNKTVLITGSSRGIGRAAALALSAAGYAVVLHGRRPSAALDAVVADIRANGKSVRCFTFDVADRTEAAEVLQNDIEQHGAYYGVVLNAGISRDNAFPALTNSDWDSVLHTNLDSFYNVLHPIIMPMIRRRAAGRIVCMTSVSGLIGNRGQVNYSAAKAGIIGAAKALALELAKRQITVNCVAPGLIDTDMLSDDVPINEIIKMIPAQRMGLPEEVAHAVVFLMSEQAAYITRQVLAVNGGLC